MKTESWYNLAAAALALAWMLTPAKTEAAKNRNFTVDFQGNAEHCSDLRVRSDGQIAQTAETFTAPKSAAPLELSALDRGIVRVIGADRADFSVEACKLAVADTRAEADQAVAGISVTRSASRFSASGPSGENTQWEVYFIVHAPKDGNLDIETRNGPIDVRDVSGNLKVRATNGPVSLRDCGGLVNAHTANGPISFSGSGGEVHLIAQNGPISVKVSGDTWNGTQLEARTVNGPLSVHVPDTFTSGVRLETDGHAPVSCRMAACRNALTDAGSDQRVLQMNGSTDTLRLSTHNGPVSLTGGGKSPAVM
ncbi:MAG: hypothetical protein LAP87_24440 [Acidobacteriia bacterium]|nr:hypothetical protein [Terriglobia bacterium]